MKRVFCLWLLLCSLLINAQPVKTLRPLTLHDRVPDLAFARLYNYSASSASLSQFKSRLTILDQWSTWCSSCIREFPFLDSMQQHYPGLRVLLVDISPLDNLQKISHLFNTLQRDNLGKALRLPVVYDDSLPGVLFPLKVLPQYVWLDSNRRVIAITGLEELTEANIRAVLEGHIPPMELKEDLDPIDREKPLFVNNNGGSGNGILYRSTLSARIPGFGSSTLGPTSKHATLGHMIYTNTPALTLLFNAWRPKVGYSRFHFEGVDSSQLQFNGKPAAWIAAHSYTYELITPALTPDSFFHYMQADLFRYFGLAGRTGDRLTDCYTLTADTAILRQFSNTGGKSVNDLYSHSSRSLHNRHLDELCEYLEQQLNIPVINETGWTIPVSLSLPDGDILHPANLQTILKAYGLSFTPAQRVLSNFIIYHPKQLP